MLSLERTFTSSFALRGCCPFGFYPTYPLCFKTYFAFSIPIRYRCSAVPLDQREKVFGSSKKEVDPLHSPSE
jgi:hypothetical protein